MCVCVCEPNVFALLLARRQESGDVVFVCVCVCLCGGEREGAIDWHRYPASKESLIRFADVADDESRR